jgi:hypothetical protein
VVGGTNTINLSSFDKGYPTPITIGANLILSPDSTAPGEYIIGAQTLIPGGPAAIVDGTAVTLDQSGKFLIIDDTSTRNINPTAPTVTIGSETLARNPTGQCVLDGKNSHSRRTRHNR